MHNTVGQLYNKMSTMISSRGSQTIMNNRIKNTLYKHKPQKVSQLINSHKQN